MCEKLQRTNEGLEREKAEMGQRWKEMQQRVQEYVETAERLRQSHEGLSDMVGKLLRPKNLLSS